MAHVRLNERGSGRTEHNYAKMGYFRTDDETTAGLVKFLAPVEKGQAVHIFDPCCGEGIVLGDISNHLSLGHGSVQSYGIEIERNRANVARKLLTHVRHGSHDDMRISAESMGFIFLNPPYGETSKNASGKTERLVHLFYRKNIHYLHPEGVLALLIPTSDLTPGFCQGLSRFKNVQIFEAAVDTYKQVLILAQNQPNRGAKEIDRETYDLLKAVGSHDVSVFNVKNIHPEIVYSIPASKTPAFTSQALSVDDAHHLAMNHPRKQALLDHILRSEMPIPKPLTKVQDGHIATSLIPSGVLNGRVEGEGGEFHLLQGTTYKQIITKSTIKVHEDHTIHEQRDRELTQSEIIALKKLPQNKILLTRVTRETNSETKETADETSNEA